MMARRSGSVFVGILGILSGLVATVAQADEWPGFRGPRADGTAVVGALADREQVGLRIAWKHALGSGYSGVAVAGGRVVTMAAGRDNDLVLAFDATDGHELWRFAIDKPYTGHDGSHDGPISTPLLAEGRVFALAPRGRFVALDAATAKLLWSTDLVADHGATQPHYGFATSPLYAGGVVVLQVGSEQGAVVGFDPKTGERVWSAGQDAVDYQSPIHYTDAGGEVVLAVGGKNLMAVDPATGTIRWTLAHGGGGMQTAPSMSPVPAGPSRIFLPYKDTASAAFERTGDSWTRLWEQNSIRRSYNQAVYHNGYLYAYSARFLTCVDAATGQSKWRSRQPGDGFLILVDDDLVIATKKGGMHLVKASPDGYQKVASIRVFDDLCWTNPSFANRSIYARGLGGIARIDVTGGKTAIRADQHDGEPPADSDFGRFLATVRGAEDKTAVIDAYLSDHPRFPIIEGDRWVHFVYRGQGDDLAVAGDLFGARQERSMLRVDGTDLFYYALQTDPDARFNYLFMRDYTEITDPRNPRTTYTTMLTKDMEMSFFGGRLDMSWAAMPRWRKPTHLGDPPSDRRGAVASQRIDSKVLQSPVALDVYLPHGYADTAQRYDVVYVHGGSAAREHGNWQTTLDNIDGRTTAPLIVVFINHFARDSGTYAEMFATELVPFIDKTYRTINSADARASVGMGFSGMSALFCAAKHPDLVAKVALQSPFLFDMIRGPVDQLLAGPKQSPLTIYMDWGKYDLRNPHEAWDIGKTAGKFADSLREKGYRLLGGEVHDGTGWSSWKNRTDVILEALFPVAQSG